MKPSDLDEDQEAKLEKMKQELEAAIKIGLEKAGLLYSNENRIAVAMHVLKDENKYDCTYDSLVEDAIKALASKLK